MKVIRGIIFVIRDLIDAVRDVKDRYDESRLIKIERKNDKDEVTIGRKLRRMDAKTRLINSEADVIKSKIR